MQLLQQRLRAAVHLYAMAAVISKLQGMLEWPRNAESRTGAKRQREWQRPFPGHAVGTCTAT